MTEKEKCEQGLLYKCMDSELVREREVAKQLCFKYNQLGNSQNQERKEILTKLFKKVGKSFLIEPSFWCDYGYNISIGESFYSNHNLVILDVADVSFGNKVMIGPNCGFYTAGHPLEADIRNQSLEYAKPITVGNNVWIGGNVVVLPGVTIGNNVVIGAGSIVTKDIPDNMLAYGNPCKVIRKIENKEEI